MIKTFSREIREAFYKKDLLLTIKLVKEIIHAHKLTLAKNAQNQDGLVICRKLSILVDRLIRCMWDQLSWGESDHHEASVAVVAVGGYGRQELCPKSDIDILFLTSKNLNENQKTQVEFFIQRLWDYGFDVGSSVRSINQCWDMRKSDIKTWTSFLDERFVIGNFKLYQQFVVKMKKRGIIDHRDFFIQCKVEERQKRVHRYGGWSQFLEPNLKEVSGGLRDVQTIFWIAKQKYDIRNFDDLIRYQIFRPKDCMDLENAYSFLLQSRWWLHFVTDQKKDILSFDVQTKVAENFVFDKKEESKTQQFLGYLNLYIKIINRVTGEFLSCWDKQRRTKSLYFKNNSHTFFTENKGTLDNKPTNSNCFIHHNDLIFEYFEIMNQTGLAMGSLSHAKLVQAVQYFELKTMDTSFFLRRFLNLMQRGTNIEQVLYVMHDVGLIELIVPDFKIIHSHSQHSMYHIYTTDTHTLVLLTTLSRLRYNQDPKLTEIVKAYSLINDLDVLYLACLFHDIGKGVPGNHSETGAVMIERYMMKQGFHSSQIKEASKLVLYHLEMNEIAQRRNIEDLDVIENFLKKIDQPSTIHKLYVLTYCDTSSVHPDAWSDWKNDLLKKLYLKTLEYKKSNNLFLNIPDKKKQLLEEGSFEGKEDKVKKHLDLMPIAYTMVVSSSVLEVHVKMLEQLKNEKVVINVFHSTHCIDVYILTQDTLYLLLAMMKSFLKMNISVIAAKIYTRQDGLILDQFKCKIEDKDKNEEVLINLKSNLKKDLLNHFKNPIQEINYELFHRKKERASISADVHYDTQIDVSNSISYDFSVIDISCIDFSGVIYLIMFVLHKCKVQVHGANVSTEAGKTFNAFYVTGADYKKITSVKDIEMIKRNLKEYLSLKDIGFSS